MGLEIQKQLCSNPAVPNCLINAGFHWSSAFAHAQRTESNPSDLHTELETNGDMKLTWQKVEGASGYILERKLEGEPGYKIIAHLDGAISTYLEKKCVGS